MIFIRTSYGIEAGVCMGCHSDEPFGGDIVRQQCIQSMQEFGSFHRKRCGFPIEMGKQLFGMNTGIRAPAPHGGGVPA